MRALLLLGLWLLAGCGSRTVRYEARRDAVAGKPVILFVPGFYGSALADEETGERYFLTAWKALFSGTPLALAKPDLGVPGARPLRPDGVLEAIRIVPGLFSKNVYGEAMDFLRDELGRDAAIVPFAYDWRQDVPETAARLDALVRELRDAGARSVGILAHSMGGLVTTYWLRYGGQSPEVAVDDDRGAKLVRAVVLAGTPFAGSPTAFRNLQTGTSLGGASIPLGQLSLSTFPSMYQLMPAPGATAESLYVPEQWEARRWGLFKDRGADAEIAARRKVAALRYLRRAERFWRKLRADGVHRALPVLVLVGTGQPTYGAPDGDGTVPTTSATPPETLRRRFDVRTIVTPVHHEEMFADATFLREAKKLLQ